MSETTQPETTPTPAPAQPDLSRIAPAGITADELAALLADVSKIGDEIIAEMDSLGPAITKEALAETAAADPTTRHEVLDGHMEAGIAKAEAAKKAVVDKLKSIAITVGTIAAGAAGGPGGAAAASALAGALAPKTEQPAA